MKLLIDECLSEELSKRARDRGHPESSHVRWIGKTGAKDWLLLPVILDGDWTFVTRNSVDFRGPASAPGSKGEYRKACLHAASSASTDRPAWTSTCRSNCSMQRGSAWMRWSGWQRMPGSRFGWRSRAPRAETFPPIRRRLPVGPASRTAQPVDTIQGIAQ